MLRLSPPRIQWIPLMPEVWYVPSWAYVEYSVLDSYLALLLSYFNVQNMSVWNHP
jgi:hypothetical protein